MKVAKTKAPTRAKRTYEPLTAKTVAAMPSEAQKRVWTVITAIQSAAAISGSSITLKVEEIHNKGVGQDELDTIINRLQKADMFTIKDVGAAYVSDDTGGEPENDFVPFIPYEKYQQGSSLTLFYYRLNLNERFQKEFAKRQLLAKENPVQPIDAFNNKRVSFERKPNSNRGWLHIPGYPPLPFDKVRCDIIDYLLNESAGAWRTYEDMPLGSWKTAHDRQPTKATIRQAITGINTRIKRHTYKKYPEAIAVDNQSGVGKKIDNKFRWTLRPVD